MTLPVSTALSVAFVGFGEVGQRLAADMSAARAKATLVAWDRLFATQDSAPWRACDAQHQVRCGQNMRDAVDGAEVIVCAVTAGQCVAAAAEAAPVFRGAPYYLDLNSVSPATREQAARLIEARGGRYVEAAVMSPMSPRGIASPILLGGPHATSFLAMAHRLGLTGAKPFSGAIGPASAAKMARSVLVKGLEALLTESLLSAHHFGVEQTVLDSLSDLLPLADWHGIARYMIQRSIQHGLRRAEELHEVARTVSEAGIQPWMSEACAQRQHWAATHLRTVPAATIVELLANLSEQLAGKPETTHHTELPLTLP
jgi:3-hydroxyisobutyrate dehydrogenase-like beta-hydroxyacid dehydrogenase